MSDFVLKLAGSGLSAAPAHKARPTGNWITAAEAGERAGLNPGNIRKMILEEGWAQRGLARQAKLASGQTGWEVDEGCDPRFASPATLNAFQRARRFDWNSVAEKQRQVALFRLSLLEDCDHFVRNARPGRPAVEAIAEFLDKRRIDLTVRSYQRLAAKFAAMGAPDGLFDNRLDGISRPSGYAEFYALFKAAYLEYGSAKVGAVYRLICAKVRTQKLGIDIPTDRQIRRFALSIPIGEKVYHRAGPKKFDDQCAAFIERDWTRIKVEEHGEVIVRAMETNDIWCADHHPCDVIVHHEGKLLRPWLSAWMDMRSRRIVGRVISFRDPNQTTVLLALRDGVMRNGLLLPGWAFTDNGKDYDAWMWDGRTKKQRKLRIACDPDHFGGVYQQLQIGHLHARPYNAKAKPIERFFRTFEEQFGVFEKTYCGRSTDTKPERLAERLSRGLAPEFEDFQRRALAWIDDVYANQPSDAQPVDGGTPAEIYTANIGTRRLTTVEQLDCCLMLTKSLKVGRNGIQWQHRTYGRGDPAIRHLANKQVLLRIDPADVTSAQVWDVTGRQRLCIVARNDLSVVSTVSDDQERQAIRTMNSHNRALKGVRRRGMRMIESPAEIILEDAIQQARQSAADRPQTPPPTGGMKMIQTGIDTQSIADQPPLRKAVGAESGIFNSTLAQMAEED